MPITLNDALTDFYNIRLRQRALNTRVSHESFLEQMRQWITRETQVNVYLQDIDDRMLNRFFNRYLPPGHQASTYNTYRQYADAFWRFCRDESWISTNPMRHVDRLPEPRRVRLLLSPDELQAMLDDANPRDRIALAIGMNTALRQGDIARLKVGDVNLANLTLQTEIEKTKDSDGLPITAELHDELLRWFRAYGELAGVPWREIPLHWPLVPPTKSTSKGLARTDPLRVWGVVTDRHMHGGLERIVQKALEKIGHPTKGEGFHTLRRSGLRVLFDLAAEDGIGDPIRIPQSLAGHKSRMTTERYLGVTHERRLRDEMLRGKSFLGRAAESQRRQRGEGIGDGLRAVD